MFSRLCGLCTDGMTLKPLYLDVQCPASVGFVSQVFDDIVILFCVKCLYVHSRNIHAGDIIRISIKTFSVCVFVCVC